MQIQVKWNDQTNVDVKSLELLLLELKKSSCKSEMWNTSIVDMVRLYFVDIFRIFSSLEKKLKHGGKIYFNVSNSAYFNVLVDTIKITCDIAEKVGLSVKEIRKARLLNPSPQQKESIGKLLEAVIVIEKRSKEV